MPNVQPVALATCAPLAPGACARSGGACARSAGACVCILPCSASPAARTFFTERADAPQNALSLQNAQHADDARTFARMHTRRRNADNMQTQMKTHTRATTAAGASANTYTDACFFYQSTSDSARIDLKCDRCGRRHAPAVCGGAPLPW